MLSTAMATEATPQMEYRVRIRDLPNDARPRERLRDFGAGALSTPELLAILFRTGATNENVLALSSRVLSRFGGLTELARASFAELCAEHGLGEAKAAQLQAALELGRRLASASPDERLQIRSPADIATLLGPEMGVLDQEHLRVVLLNVRNQVLAVSEVYRGSVHSSVVRLAELFREPVRQNASAIILVHNHPSGDPTASRPDIEMTKQAVQVGELLDIDVVDHVILAQGRSYSLKEDGKLFA
jgi:DNA repair protein RadC